MGTEGQARGSSMLTSDDWRRKSSEQPRCSKLPANCGCLSGSPLQNSRDILGSDTQSLWKRLLLKVESCPDWPLHRHDPNWASAIAVPSKSWNVLATFAENPLEFAPGPGVRGPFSAQRCRSTEISDTPAAVEDLSCVLPEKAFLLEVSCRKRLRA